MNGPRELLEGLRLLLQSPARRPQAEGASLAFGFGYAHSDLSRSFTSARFTAGSSDRLQWL